MKYVKVGTTDVLISQLGFGAWGIGGGTSWADTDDERSVALVREAIDSGINLVDTAPVYGTGHSEEVLGRALADGYREKCILSTKCTMQWHDPVGVKMYSRDGQDVYKCFDPASLRNDLECSLRRLKTDHIDIYFTHRQPDDINEVETVYATLEKFREEGKIRVIGISNANPEYLKKYLECGRIDIVQEKYSILDQKWAKEYLPLCRENQVAFQGFSVLERGLLAGKIGMDYEIQKGEARGTIGWFKPERRKLVLDMLESWKPLCEKYGCSMANLVMATSLATEGFTTLCGVRHRENLLDTMKSVDISLSAEDLARIRSDCDGVIAAAAELKASKL